MQEDNNAIETSIDSGICDDITSPTTAEKAKKAENNMKMFQQILLVLERDKLLRAEQRKRLSQLTERRQRRKRIEEPCNVCCIDLDGDNIKSSVKCVNCQKIACRGTSCSIWIPSQSGWECQLCNQSQESISKSSEWLHQQITGRYLSPFSALSEPSLLRNHHSPTPDVDRRSDVASSFYGDQKERVREMIEETLGEMLGGSLDNISVNQLYKSRQYLPTWENGEAPGMSHLKLKRFIEKIINDAIRLPNFTNEPSTPGPITDQDLPFFDPKKYQELLATAVLNKIVDSYNYEQKFDNNNKDAATDCSDLDTNHNALISRKVQSGSISSSSIEPESDCSITDPPSHASRLEDFSRSSSAANQFAEALGRYDRNSSSMLTDYLNKHSVPLPDFSIESDSSNEDNLSASKNMGPSWEGNWLFKKKRPGHESPAPIGMLVPSPKEDIKTQIGDKTADELSDLSEAGSECGDNNVDEIEDNAPNAIIQNRNIIGGKSPIGLFDELLEQTSLVSSSSIPEGTSVYTETKNDYVLGDDLNHDLVKSTKSFIAEEAINSLVDTQTLQNNLSKAPIKANLEELPKPRPRSAQKAAVYLSTREIPESELTSSSTASSAISSEAPCQLLNKNPQSESTNINTNQNLTPEEKPTDYNITDTMLKKIQCTKASAIQFLVVVSLAPSLAVPSPDSETLEAITQASNPESSQQEGDREKGEKSKNEKQEDLADNDVKTQNKNDLTVVESKKDELENDKPIKNDDSLNGAPKERTNSESVKEMEAEKEKYLEDESTEPKLPLSTPVGTALENFKHGSPKTMVKSSTAQVLESEAVNEISLKDEIEALDKCPESKVQPTLVSKNSVSYENEGVNPEKAKLSTENISEYFEGNNDFDNEPAYLAQITEENTSKKDLSTTVISFDHIAATDSHKNVSTSAEHAKSSQILQSLTVLDDKLMLSSEAESKVNTSNASPELIDKPDLFADAFASKECDILVLKDDVFVRTIDPFDASNNIENIGAAFNLAEATSLTETVINVTNEEVMIPNGSSDLPESHSQLILEPSVKNIAENNLIEKLSKLNDKDINSEELIVEKFETVDDISLKNSYSSEKLQLSLGNGGEKTESGMSFTNNTEGDALPDQNPVCYDDKETEDRSGHTFKPYPILDSASKDESCLQDVKNLNIESLQTSHEDNSANFSSSAVESVDSSQKTETGVNDSTHISEDTPSKTFVATPDSNANDKNSIFTSESAADNENFLSTNATLRSTEKNNLIVTESQAAIVISTLSAKSLIEIQKSLKVLADRNEPKTQCQTADSLSSAPIANAQKILQLSTKEDVLNNSSLDTSAVLTEGDVSDNSSLDTSAALVERDVSDKSSQEEGHAYHFIIDVNASKIKLLSAATQPVKHVCSIQVEQKLVDIVPDESLREKSSCDRPEPTDTANLDKDSKCSGLSNIPTDNLNKASQAKMQTTLNSTDRTPVSLITPILQEIASKDPLITEQSGLNSNIIENEPTLDEELPPEYMGLSSPELKEDLSNASESSSSISVIENSQENINIAEISENEIEMLLDDEKPPEALDGIENLGNDVVCTTFQGVQSSTVSESLVYTIEEVTGSSKAHLDVYPDTPSGKHSPIVSNASPAVTSTIIPVEGKINEKCDEISCFLCTDTNRSESLPRQNVNQKVDTNKCSTKKCDHLRENSDILADNQENAAFANSDSNMSVCESNSETTKELTIIPKPLNQAVQGCINTIASCRTDNVFHDKQVDQSAGVIPSDTSKYLRFGECTENLAADQDEYNYRLLQSNEEIASPVPNFIFESFVRIDSNSSSDVISTQAIIPQEQVACKLDNTEPEITKNEPSQINASGTDEKNSIVPEQIENDFVKSTEAKSMENLESYFLNSFTKVNNKCSKVEGNINKLISSESCQLASVAVSNSEVSSTNQKIIPDELKPEDILAPTFKENLLQTNNPTHGISLNEKTNINHYGDRDIAIITEVDCCTSKEPASVELMSSGSDGSYSEATQSIEAECCPKLDDEMSINTDHFTEISYMIRLSPITSEVISNLDDFSSVEKSVAADLTKVETSVSSSCKESQELLVEPQQIEAAEVVDSALQSSNQKTTHFNETYCMTGVSSIIPEANSEKEDINHAKESVTVDLANINTNEAFILIQPKKSVMEPEKNTIVECLLESVCPLQNKMDTHFSEIPYTIRLSPNFEADLPKMPGKLSTDLQEVTPENNLPETTCHLFNQGEIHLPETPYPIRISSSLETDLLKEPEKPTLLEDLSKLPAISQRDVHFTETPYAIRLSPSLDISSSDKSMYEADTNINLSAIEPEEFIRKPQNQKPSQENVHLSERPYMMRFSPTYHDDNFKLYCSGYNDQADSAVDLEVGLKVSNTERKRSLGFLETIFERQDTTESIENTSLLKEVVNNYVDISFQSCPNNHILFLNETANHQNIAEITSDTYIADMKNHHGSTGKNKETTSFEQKFSLNSEAQLQETLELVEKGQENNSATDESKEGGIISDGHRNNLDSIVEETTIEYQQENTYLEVVSASVNPSSEKLLPKSFRAVTSNFSTSEDSEVKPQVTDCLRQLNENSLASPEQAVTNADKTHTEPADISAEFESSSKYNESGLSAINSESECYKESALPDSSENASTHSASYSEKSNTISTFPSENARPNKQFKPNILVKSNSEIATLELILHGDTETVVDSTECFVENIIDPPADFATKMTMPDCVQESISPNSDNFKDSDEANLELEDSGDVNQRSNIGDKVDDDEKVHSVDNDVDCEQKIGLIDNQGANNMQYTDAKDNVALVSKTNVQKEDNVAPSRTFFANANLNLSETSHDLMKEEERLQKQKVIVDELSYASENKTSEVFDIAIENSLDNTHVECSKSTSELNSTTTTTNCRSDSQSNANKSCLCLNPEENLNEIQQQLLDDTLETGNQNLSDDTSMIEYEESQRGSTIPRTHGTRNPEHSILEIRKLIEEVLNDPIMLSSENDSSDQEENPEVDFNIPSVSQTANLTVALDSFLENTSDYIEAQMSSEIPETSAEESSRYTVDSESATEKPCDIYVAENLASLSKEPEKENVLECKLIEESASASRLLEECTTKKDDFYISQQYPASLVQSCIAALALNDRRQNYCNHVMGRPKAYESISEAINHVKSENLHFQKANLGEYRTLNSTSNSAAVTLVDNKFQNNSEVKNEQIATAENAVTLVVKQVPFPQDPKIISDNEPLLYDDKFNSTEETDCSGICNNDPGNDEILSGAIESPLHFEENSTLSKLTSITNMTCKIESTNAQSDCGSCFITNSISSEDKEQTSIKTESSDTLTTFTSTPGEDILELTEKSHADAIKDELNICSNLVTENHEEITVNTKITVKADSEILPDMKTLNNFTDSKQSDQHVENSNASDILEKSESQAGTSKFIVANKKSQEIKNSENSDESESTADSSPEICSKDVNQIIAADTEAKDTISDGTASSSLKNSTLSEIDINDTMIINIVSVSTQNTHDETKPDIKTVSETNMEKETSLTNTPPINFDRILDTEISSKLNLENSFPTETTQNVSSSSESWWSSDTKPETTEFPASDKLSNNIISVDTDKIKPDDTKSATKISIIERPTESYESQNTFKLETGSIDEYSKNLAKLNKLSDQISSKLNSDPKDFAIDYCQSSNKMNLETLNEIKEKENSDQLIESSTQKEVTEPNFAGKIPETVSPSTETSEEALSNLSNSTSMILPCCDNLQAEISQIPSTELLKFQEIAVINKENKTEPGIEPNDANLNTRSSDFISTSPIEMSDLFLDACKESSDTDLENWIKHLEKVIVELSNSTSIASSDSTFIVKQKVDENFTELEIKSTEIISHSISAGVSNLSSTLEVPMNVTSTILGSDQEDSSPPFDREYEKIETFNRNEATEFSRLTQNTEVFESIENAENCTTTSKIQPASSYNADDTPLTFSQNTETPNSQLPSLDKPDNKPIFRREPTIVITQASSDSQSDNAESISDSSGMPPNLETKNQFEDANEFSSLSELENLHHNVDLNNSSGELPILQEVTNATAPLNDIPPDDLGKYTNSAMNYKKKLDDNPHVKAVIPTAEVTLQEVENFQAVVDLGQNNRIGFGREKSLQGEDNNDSKQTKINSNQIVENTLSVKADPPSEYNQLADNIQESEDLDEEIYQSDYALEYESFTSMQFIKTPPREIESQPTNDVVSEPIDDTSVLNSGSFVTYNSMAQIESSAIDFEPANTSVHTVTEQTANPMDMLTVERLECKATSSSSEDVSAYDTAPSSFTEVLSLTPLTNKPSIITAETANIPTNSSAKNVFDSMTGQDVDKTCELITASTPTENIQFSENLTIASYSSVSVIHEELKQNQTEAKIVSCADGNHCIITDGINSSSFIQPSEGILYQSSATAVTGSRQSENSLGREIMELEHPIKIPIFEAKRCYERRATLVSPSLEIAEDALEALDTDTNYVADPLPTSGSSNISAEIEETTFMNPIYTSTDSLPWHAIKDDNEEIDGGLTSPESEPEFSITPPEISLCYMTPHVLDIIPEEFSESPPLDGTMTTCLSSYQIENYFMQGTDTYSNKNQVERPQDSTKQSPYEASTLNLKKTQENDTTLDTTQQEDKFSSLTITITESSSAFTITNTELIQANVEVSTLPTDKLTYNESSSTTTTTSNDTVCTAVESLSRKIESQLSTDDEVELHKDVETALTKSPEIKKSYSVSMSMQLTNEPTNTPSTHQTTQNPSITEVNVHSTSSKSAPTSASTSPFHATRADSFGSASYATTKQQQIKFEILKHAAFSQPLPDEEDAAENGHISHFLPGSIAEREHKKWYNAVEMPNNPYSREALKRRLSATSDKPMDIPNINSPLEKATSEDKLGRTGKEDETIIEAPKVDYKRYGRDYYINDAKYASGSSKLKLSSSVSMHGLNVRGDDKSLDKEPTLQSQQSLSSSLSSLYRSHSWGDKRSNSNIVSGGGGGSTCDIFTARPVRVEESDPILSRATKLEYLSTPDRDFYLLPSEEISSLRSISASEHSLSQAGDSLTPSEDSDTIRVYDLKKQETRLIRDDDSISAVTAVKGLIYTNNSSRAQQPGQTPTSPRAPLTTQRSFRTTVINRGSTPTAFKFLQPKRRLYDTRRIMSEDTSAIVRENASRTNDTVEKSVIEEDVIPALPSVKALAKVFQGSTDSSNVQLNRPKSYSWKSVDVKTKEEPAPVEKTFAPEPVPRTILPTQPAVNGEEKLENEPAKESYSPSYEQKYIPAESPVIPPEEISTYAAEEDLKIPEPKEREVTVNSITNPEPTSEPIQIEEQSSQTSAPVEEPVPTSQSESLIELSTVLETPKEEVHIPKEPCEDSYSPPYDQKYIPAEAPASQSLQEESETIQKPAEETVDQSNSLEWKEDNIEIVSTPKDNQHATPPNTPENEEQKTPEETDKPIIESISLPTETLDTSMNPSHKPTIVEQFLENEKRSAMPPVSAAAATNASVLEETKNGSTSEFVSESEAVQFSSSVPSSAAETTAPDTTSTLESTNQPMPTEPTPTEEPKSALEPTSEPTLINESASTEEQIETSAPTTTAEPTPTAEVIPAVETVPAVEPTEPPKTPEPFSVPEPTSTSKENSIDGKVLEATLNDEHPTIDTKPAQNGFSEPSPASPTQNAPAEQSKQNNTENRRSEIRFTQESHTRDRPISPVLVPGKLKSSIAFFENLKNKK